MVQIREGARSFYRNKGYERLASQLQKSSGPYEVFVSHSHFDTARAVKVANCLQEHQRKTVYLDVLD